MNYTLKPELIDELLEIIREGSPIIFDTKVVSPSEYEFYYNSGFQWAFDVT